MVPRSSWCRPRTASLTPSTSGGGLQRGDDVTGPVADKRAQPGAGQRRGVVLRDRPRAGEDPGGDDVQQELTGAVCRPGHGDLRRRDLRVPRVQADAGGGLTGSGAQVEPADLVRRVRAQVEHARPHCRTGHPGPEDEAEGVAGAPVIGRGELAGDEQMRMRRLGAWSRRRSVHPAGRREPAAPRGPQVGEQAQLAADLVVPDPDHLAGRHHLPWRLPGRGERVGDGPGGPDPVQPRQRLRCHAGCLVPRGQGKIEFGPDLVGGADVDRTDRDQRLRDQRQPAGRSPGQGAGRGRAAQFGLGQLPQVGFRTSAVHVSSVLPKPTAAAGPLAWPR